MTYIYIGNFVNFINRCYETTFKIEYQYFCKYLYNIINYALYELVLEILFFKTLNIYR